MSIGNISSVDLATNRPAPATTPVTPTQSALQESPVFPPVQPVSQEAIAAAVKSANAYTQSVNTSLQFSLDQDSGRTVVKMIDTATDEVLRQLPSEDILAISKSIERMQNLLINREA